MRVDVRKINNDFNDVYGELKMFNFEKIGEYKNMVVLKSKDINDTHCYVDANNNKIKEPIYFLRFVIIKNNLRFSFTDNTNYRKSNFDNLDIEKITKDKYESYYNKRREFVLSTRKYLNEIRKIKPYKITLSICGTEIIVITKPSNDYNMKKINLYVNGYPTHINFEIEKDKNIENDTNHLMFLLGYYYSNQYEKYELPFTHNVTINKSINRKLNMIGLTFNIYGKKVRVKNVSHYSTYGDGHYFELIDFNDEKTIIPCDYDLYKCIDIEGDLNLVETHVVLINKLNYAN